MQRIERRPRVLFVGGSINQTKQMHQIANALPEVDARFTPYYLDGAAEWLVRAGLLEWAIPGRTLQRRCLEYLRDHRLPVDPYGAEGGYDLALTCSDLYVPDNLRRQPLVAVQEGILDPPTPLYFSLVKRFPFLSRVPAGTGATGLSGAYERFCVASEGYREYFVSHGAPPERLVVTGIPNFDDCDRYRTNRFPHRGYVLVCTSDARETFKIDRRKKFIQKAVRIAAGRPMIFKLHPNERVDRATREIARWAPGARVYAEGCAEEMIANCDVLVTQYSTLTFIGVALGKEVHSYHPPGEVRRLLPIQNRRAASNIADVCRELLQRRGFVLRARARDVTPEREAAE